MSEVFQAVVVEGGTVELKTWLGPPPLGSLLVAPRDGLVALSPPLPETRDLDCLVGATLAMHLSTFTRVALHVVLDTRVGLRHSQLFRRGSPQQVFGSRTERWYRLDDNGEPIRIATYGSEELVESEEYETAEDAIDQGLRAAGFETSRLALVQALCYGSTK